MKKNTDALVALQYDTCEKLESCEPCKGVRQMAIDEIIRLRAVLENIRTHVQISTPTGYRYSAVWHLADRALSSEEQ